MKTSEKRESMKIVPPGKKKCVWMEAGVVSYKLCDNNFDCSTCSYDHAMLDKVARHKAAAVAQPIPAAPEKFNETWVDNDAASCKPAQVSLHDYRGSGSQDMPQRLRVRQLLF